MKQKFIRKNTQARFIRPVRPQSTFVVDASDGTIKKNEINPTEIKSRKTTKNNTKDENKDMKKIDDINEIISDEQTVDNKEKSNATKKIGGKNSDGLMERIDVTLVTSDNKTLLTD